MNFSRVNKARKPVIPRLPLVAFIDVVLFLLLYFVVATSVNPPEGQLGAALRTDSKGGGQAASLTPQILRVESDGSGVVFKMGDRTVQTADGLLALLKQLPKEAGIVVRVAGNVPVDAAAAAVSAGRQAGFVKISYVPGS